MKHRIFTPWNQTIQACASVNYMKTLKPSFKDQVSKLLSPWLTIEIPSPSWVSHERR